MFHHFSIAKKMNYLIAMATFVIFGATLFVFISINRIESQYEHLHNNSMTAALSTLRIEKHLNYVSRTTRDIMLGGNYEQDIQKLKRALNLSVVVLTPLKY